LDVHCFGLRAGTLTDGPPAMRFGYADSWVQAGRPPLSQSLPLDGGFGAEAVAAFFGGLLPEGRPRAVLARQLGVSERNDFALLAAIGGDTAGAVSLVEPGAATPATTGTEVDWLDDAGLAAVIDELPVRPMHADEEGEYRLSLAGVQDKLPVVVGGDGRIGLTKGRAPSTHILKTPIDRLTDTVINEAFCLALGRALRVDTVMATPRVVEGREFLLIERYDRGRTADGIERLHQEDFCQALGIPSERKYQSEGGPGLSDCFALVRRATAVPARDTIRLLDVIGLNFLVGNHDAHGKNFSLLYVPDAATATLAPAYDVLSSIVYLRTQRMSKNMAMKLGSIYRPDYARPSHLTAFLEGAGLGVGVSRRRLRAMARRAPEAAALVRAEFAGSGWDRELLGEIVEVVEQRAGWLERMAE
jgi:serine/threonine-protein kinase HipA